MTLASSSSCLNDDVFVSNKPATRGKTSKLEHALARSRPAQSTTISKLACVSAQALNAAAGARSAKPKLSSTRHAPSATSQAAQAVSARAESPIKLQAIKPASWPTHIESTKSVPTLASLSFTPTAASDKASAHATCVLPAPELSAHTASAQAKASFQQAQALAPASRARPQTASQQHTARFQA